MNERRRGLSIARWSLAALVLVGAALHALRYAAPFEDSFITYRYATHLAAGQGLVFNVGEVVDGFTSLSWTLLLAALVKLGVSLPLYAPVVSLAFGVALVGATMVLHRDLAATSRRRDAGEAAAFADAPGASEPTSWWGPSASAAIVAAYASWAYFAMTGMETSLFVLLLVVAAIAIVRDRGATAGLLLAVAAMTRPEGLGYAIAIAVAIALSAAPRSSLVRLAATFAPLYALYFAWHWHRFGYPWPNTYYAKAAGVGAVYRRGLVGAEAFLTSHGFWLELVACVAMAARSRRAVGWTIACAIPFAAVASEIVVGGDTFYFFRFLLPAIPFGAVAATTLLEHAFDRARRRRGAALVVAVGVAALVAAPIAGDHTAVRTLLARTDRSDFARFEDAASYAPDYFAIGAWLRANVAPDTWIALNPAGIIPFVSALPTIDMLGLNDAHIAHAPIRLGRGVQGHEKFDAGYVLSRRPKIVLLGFPRLAERPFDAATLLASITESFGHIPGDRALFEDPRFLAEYDPVSVAVDGRWLVLFVRKDAPSSSGDGR